MGHPVYTIYIFLFCKITVWYEHILYIIIYIATVLANNNLRRTFDAIQRLVYGEVPITLHYTKIILGRESVPLFREMLPRRH